MTTLGEKQRQFALMVAQLIIYINSLPGYAVTLGDCYRDPRCDYGHPQSLHRQRLAVDINLFVNGEYITCVGELADLHWILYEKVGKFWENIGGTWGGRFAKSDPNHFSLEHDGVR
jgi:hypothetical protein